jgi:exodeoxyribonuclease VII small subunit
VIVSQEQVAVDALLTELERTIGQLADGGGRLEDLVGAYERATSLVEAAQARLDQITRRVQQMETTPSG